MPFLDTHNVYLIYSNAEFHFSIYLVHALREARKEPHAAICQDKKPIQFFCPFCNEWRFTGTRLNIQSFTLDWFRLFDCFSLILFFFFLEHHCKNREVDGSHSNGTCGSRDGRSAESTPSSTRTMNSNPSFTETIIQYGNESISNPITSTRFESPRIDSGEDKLPPGLLELQQIIAANKDAATSTTPSSSAASSATPSSSSSSSSSDTAAASSETSS